MLATEKSFDISGRHCSRPEFSRTHLLHPSQKYSPACPYLLIPCSIFLLENVTGSLPIKNSPHFMESECSLPHLQEAATCPYSEPDQSSPCPSIRFPEDHLNVILPSTPTSSKWTLSPPGFPIKTL